MPIDLHLPRLATIEKHALFARDILEKQTSILYESNLLDAIAQTLNRAQDQIHAVRPISTFCLYLLSLSIKDNDHGQDNFKSWF